MGRMNCHAAEVPKSHVAVDGVCLRMFMLARFLPSDHVCRELTVFTGNLGSIIVLVAVPGAMSLDERSLVEQFKRGACMLPIKVFVVGWYRSIVKL